MKDSEKYRRDFLKFLPIGTAALLVSGCTKYVEFPATEAPANPTKTPFLPNIAPTGEGTSTSTQVSENPTSTPEALRPFDPLSRFRFGKWDFSKPFKLTIPLETSSVAGYSEEKHISEDFPLPTIEKDWTGEQIEIMNSSAENNTKGNPFVVAATDRPNMVIVAAHSYQSTSFEVIRGLAAKENKWPELLGKSITLSTDGKEQTGTIASIQKIPAGLFMDGTTTDYSWGQYEDDPNGALFARTDVMGFPEEIRNDQTPGVFYVALVTCISSDGVVYTKGLAWKKGEPVIVLDMAKDSAMRAIVIVKFHE